MTEMTVARRLSPAIAFLGSLEAGLVLTGLSFAGLANNSSDSLQDHFMQAWVIVAIGVAAVLAPLAVVVAFVGFLLFQDQPGRTVSNAVDVAGAAGP